MTDTPRTDSIEPYDAPYTDSAMIHVPAAFARQLERELNQWKECAEALYSCATNDCPCDSWNAAFAMFEKLKGEEK